jgi:hypothetical protein
MVIFVAIAAVVLVAVAAFSVFRNNRNASSETEHGITRTPPDIYTRTPPDIYKSGSDSASLDQPRSSPISLNASEGSQHNGHVEEPNALTRVAAEALFRAIWEFSHG